MSFAGFNSGKFVKGRLQAALYFMRKKNRARREGGGPDPEPELEIKGFTTEYPNSYSTCIPSRTGAVMLAFVYKNESGASQDVAFELRANHELSFTAFFYASDLSAVTFPLTLADQESAPEMLAYGGLTVPQPATAYLVASVDSVGVYKSLDTAMGICPIATGTGEIVRIDANDPITNSAVVEVELRITLPEDYDHHGQIQLNVDPAYIVPGSEITSTPGAESIGGGGFVWRNQTFEAGIQKVYNLQVTATADVETIAPNFPVDGYGDNEGGGGGFFPNIHNFYDVA